MDQGEIVARGSPLDLAQSNQHFQRLLDSDTEYQRVIASGTPAALLKSIKRENTMDAAGTSTMKSSGSPSNSDDMHTIDHVDDFLKADITDNTNHTSSSSSSSSSSRSIIPAVLTRRNDGTEVTQCRRVLGINISPVVM